MILAESTETGEVVEQGTAQVVSTVISGNVKVSGYPPVFNKEILI